MKNNSIQKNTGITLIALVITIIVLLILAGISISMLTGENGLLTKASNAKTQTVVGQENDYIKLAYSSAKTKKLGGTVTAQDLQDELNLSVGNNKTTVTGSSVLKIKFKDTQNEYIVSQNGNVNKYEKPNPTDVYATVCDNGYLVFSNNQADINTYISSNSTNVVSGYEIQNIKDIHYHYNRTTDSWEGDNYLSWADDSSITNVLFLNKIVPKYTSSWFYDLIGLTSIENIQNLDTSNVTDMSCMFYACCNLREVDLSNFDTSLVTDMNNMFGSFNLEWGTIFESLDVSSFDTSNVTNMSGMFCDSIRLNSLDLSSFDTRKVTDMSYMFEYTRVSSNFNISSFDTSSVTNMRGMFNGFEGNLDLSNFDTSSVTDMSSMFSHMGQSYLDLTSFDTYNVTDMGAMFFSSYIPTIDLSSFNTSNVTDMGSMFSGCSLLETVYASSSFITDNVTAKEYIFNDCIKLKSNNGFDISIATGMTSSNAATNSTRFARVDNPPSERGYFTLKNN